MPDFERVLRKLAIDCCDDPHEQAVLKSYYKGLDRGRVECCIISCILVIVIVALLKN
jgi:hypothetical protein